MNGQTTSPTILVVEDAIFVRNFIMIALTSMGVTKIREATNGAEALDILNEENIDVVLSDWHMPEMEGIELLKTMRADEKFKDIPFLMLTSDVSQENVSDAVSSGVSDFLAKPFRHGPLIKKVKRLMEHGHHPLSKSA